MSLSLLALLLSQSPEELPKYFPARAPVVLQGQPGAWARLPLPEEVLSAVERDLSDVRLLDGRGVALPYVVQRARPAEPEESVRLQQLSAERKERTADPGTPHLFEEAAVFALPASSRRTPVLTFFTRTRTFVRRVKVEVLSEGGQVLSRVDSTLFRFSTGAEQLEVRLQKFEAQATRVRVSLSGQGEEFLFPVVTLTLAERAPADTALEWPVPEQGVQEGTATVWRFEKPRGVVPMRLALRTSTPWFDREVKVSSPNTEVGRGHVFRVAGEPQVEWLVVPLEDFASETLEVRIENEDSPPLAEVRLALVVEQPELVFVEPGVGPVTLYFGGQRTRRPRYDTAHWSRTRLPSDMAVASLGAVQDNPAYRPTPPLSEFRKPGAPVEVKDFAFQAPLRVPRGDEVTTVTFDARHVQTMAGDFRDLRLVDAQGRQWPFVLREATALLPLSTTRGAEGATASTLSFEAGGRLTALTLAVPSGTPFFSRRAGLTVEVEGQRPVELWTGQLTFNPSDRGAPSELTLPLPGETRPQATYVLTLRDDGDAPVEGLSLTGHFVVPQLLTVLDSAEYRALWGGGKHPVARYDLARVQDVLQELRSSTVAAGEVGPNPSYVAPGLLERTGGLGRWLFWGTLVLAVLVLSVLAVRIARTEPVPLPPAGGEGQGGGKPS